MDVFIAAQKEDKRLLSIASPCIYSSFAPGKGREAIALAPLPIKVIN